MKLVDIAGRKVSPLGIGTWNIGNDVQKEKMEVDAISLGLNEGIQVIDTAEMYGDGKSELLVGKTIKSFPRENLFLISKVLPENASRDKLPKSLDQTLMRLQVDQIDLYLLHWQGSVPIEETVMAMEEMKKIGKIKSWGVSNFDTNDLKKLFELPFGKNCTANQVKYNVADRGIEYDLIPFMKKNNLPLIAYSPILKGNLSDLDHKKKAILNEIADHHQASIFQILLAWTIRDGNTISIPKSGNSQHMKENADSVNITLNEFELSKIDSVFSKPQSKQRLALW
ncbi:aldo/keto reductase [Neobacillus cucumis]|uniref:aldo/keto reductase n=1 Tax=Neobacillus cucumis TaxID=1740721 RepID=UPI0018E050DF|nr:aldo/keto reductase [Neobacillus cucumis]MBI0580656.1 aldo/keto reductase [Neobacillus cucumis]